MSRARAALAPGTIAGCARSLSQMKVGIAASAKITAVMIIVPGTASAAVEPRDSAVMTHASETPSARMPPKYPRLQPHPETLPSASGRESSGRNAATRFSPIEYATLETMMKTTAHAIAPGPVHASAVVPAMQTTVEMASRRFFAACASAHAPSRGPMTITIAYEIDSAAVHAKVAQSALPATTATKYALQTA